MKKQNWNQNWRVWQDRNAFNLVFAVPQDALTVDLPYDAAFYTRQDPDCLSGGSEGYINGAVFNYYKELTLESVGQTVLLEIEGAASQSFVYVNGSIAGSCTYGYTDYFADLTPYLKGGVNQILVVTNARDQSSRYYAGCGIYRDVWLWMGDDQYIAPESLYVATKSIAGDCAVVEVSAAVKNTRAASRDVTVHYELTDGQGCVCVSADYPVLLHSGETPLRQTFYVEHPQLWDDETPYLYTCKLSIVAGDECLDSEMVVTGLRTLTVDGRQGLRVNGRTVKLRGACIHHDQGLLGASTYYEYEYRRVKRLKDAGFNAIRSAHNPASKALLSACDLLGVYVMDEVFDMWEKMKNYSDYALFFSNGWEDVVRAMVRVDFNHPSVILYSTGNEISEIGTERAYHVSRKMCELFHQLDPTRFTTNGINGAFAAGNGLIEIAAALTGKDESEFADGDINKFMGLVATAMDKIVQHRVVGDILARMDSTNDVMGYNYMTSRYLMDHEAYPQRVMVGTETYPKQIAANWAAITDCPAAIGDFTWTGYDYAGEVGGIPGVAGGNAPAFLPLHSTAGDLDILGVRRPMSYYRELVFGLTEMPRINVRAPECFGRPRQFGPWRFTDGTRCWTYPGQEGAMVTVEIYSNGDEVELYLNDVSLGRKPNHQAEGCYAAYDLPYAPGTLKAVAYRDGKVIGEDILATTDGTKKLFVDVDDYRFLPNSAGVVFVNAAVLDEHGERVVNAADQLHIEVEGGAELLAFGSIATAHDCGYRSTTVPAGEGGAMAVLRVSSLCKVTISAEGMEPDSVTIGA